MQRIALLLLLGLWVSPLFALDLLELGQHGQKWNKIRESSSFIAVAADSIWIWEAQPRANLVPHTLARKGGIYAEVLRPIGPGAPAGIAG